MCQCCSRMKYGHAGSRNERARRYSIKPGLGWWAGLVGSLLLMTRQRRGQTEGGGTSKLCYCRGGGTNHKQA